MGTEQAAGTRGARASLQRLVTARRPAPGGGVAPRAGLRALCALWVSRRRAGATAGSPTSAVGQRALAARAPPPTRPGAGSASAGGRAPPIRDSGACPLRLALPGPLRHRAWWAAAQGLYPPKRRG